MCDLRNYSSSPTSTLQNTYNQLSSLSPELNDQQSQLLEEEQASTLPKECIIYNIIYYAFLWKC